jgi:hypothetical protein
MKKMIEKVLVKNIIQLKNIRPIDQWRFDMNPL